MVFSSILFLFLFLPISITLYFLVGKTRRNVLLLIVSLVFYAWGERLYLLIMIASIITNYSCGLLIGRQKGSGRSRAYLSAAVILNLGLLASFKYANFLITNLNSISSVFGFPRLFLPPVHLPIGISFFTFQALSYVIDVFRGSVSAEENIINLGLYISLFPQLIAGPIVRFSDIAQEIVHRILTRDDFAEGIRRFVFGLGKKILIANSVGLVADQVFSLSARELTTGIAWLGVVCYSLQIYFDFSGYSDMAIGLGRMFGFHILENFNYPYISRSLREFWKRWHISLSTWFRDYLYFPLGGNRRGPIRTYLNLVIVFFLCGLWHGASWNFVVWGLFHGLFLAAERTSFGRGLKVLPLPLKHAYAILVVMLGWVVFRTESMTNAVSYVSAMFGFAYGSGVKHNLAMFLTNKLKWELCLGIILSAPVYPLTQKMGRMICETGPALVNEVMDGVISFVGFVFLSLVMYASIISLAATAYNPFIYFRF
jgi:alginate O-acetyltransferase complex protein AlgI